MPEHKQMMTLEKVIAFNPAYRAGWRDYLLARSSAELAHLLNRLTTGLDDESVQLCEAQIELMRRFAPHALLRRLYLDEQVKRDLLPKETRSQLRGFGQFDVDGKSLSEIKQKLCLPEQPLPELLAHSGLLYIRDIARDTLKDSVIIDAGAYIGDTAKLFATYYSPSKIYALEPAPANYGRMCALIDEWQLAGKIVPRQLATCDRAGPIELWGQGMGTSVIQKAELAETPGTRVEATSIDELMVAEQETRRVGCIKLDVEGAEFATIKGAVGTIKKHRPVLIVSLYHTPIDFFEIKPFIDSLDLGYNFMIRKISDDFVKELILLCFVHELPAAE
jgi:FkbM family methyltransferase